MPTPADRVPPVVRPLLSAAAAVFGGIVTARNTLYDRGVLKARPLGRPTVSVGNLTAGGTGKTPVVAWLARSLVRLGHMPAVLLRGYRAVGGRSDEAIELQQQLGPAVPVVADPDRVASAAKLLAGRPEVSVLVLDDGMQHRRAARDAELVLVDVTAPLAGLLPHGLLREPPASLARATAVLLTRCDQADKESLGVRSDQVRRHFAGPLFHGAHHPVGLEGGAAGEAGLGVESLNGRRVAAFCGIGNPLALRRTLESLGCRVVVWREFPDHHPYTAAECDQLTRAAGGAGVHQFITTAKDKARLESLGLLPRLAGLWALRVEVRVDREAELLDLLESRIRRQPNR